METTEMKINFEGELISQLLVILTKNDLIEFAPRIKLKVPGFRIINKAPYALLIKCFKEKSQTEKNVKKFLGSLAGPILEDYKSIKSFNEYDFKSKLDGLTKAKRLLLFYLLFKNDYINFFNTIRQNVSIKEDPLKGLINCEESEDFLLDMLKYHVKQERDSFRRLLNSHTNQINESNPSTFESVLSNLKNKNHTLSYLTIISIFNSKFNKEQSFYLYKLALNEVLASYQDLKKRSIILDKENQQLSNEIKMLKSEIKIRKEDINKQKQQQQHYSQTLLEKIEVTEKSITEKDNRLNILEKIITELRIENSEYKDKLASFKKNAQLFKNKNITLISKVGHELFNIVFSENQFVHYSEKNINDSNFIKEINQRIVFLNKEGLSTRDVFSIESRLKRHTTTFRIVSGEAPTVIKKMIGLMEGDCEKNEVN